MKSLNVTTKTADLRILGVSNFGRKATSGKQFQSTAFHPGANILQRAVQLWQINASFHTIRNWKPLLYSIIKISFSMKTLNEKTPDVHIPDTRHMSYIYLYIVHIPQIFSHGFPQGKNPWPAYEDLPMDLQSSAPCTCWAPHGALPSHRAQCGASCCPWCCTCPGGRGMCGGWMELDMTIWISMNNIYIYIYILMILTYI